MSRETVMSEEVFSAMLDQAIQDLRDSGMDPAEIFAVVEECFGIAYAQRFCTRLTSYHTRENGPSSFR